MDVLGDTSDLAQKYADLADTTVSTETDGALVVDVPVALAAAGVWSVTYELRGDEIGGSLTVLISSELVAPSPAATNELARIATAAGWSEEGPVPTVPGAFCGAIAQFVESSRYSDDLPLYSVEATNVLRLVESTIPGVANAKDPRG